MMVTVHTLPLFTSALGRSERDGGDFFGGRTEMTGVTLQVSGTLLSAEPPPESVSEVLIESHL